MPTPVHHTRLRELLTVAEKLGSATLTADEVHSLVDEVSRARDLSHDAQQLVKAAARRVGLVVLERGEA